MVVRFRSKRLTYESATMSIFDLSAEARSKTGGGGDRVDRGRAEDQVAGQTVSRDRRDCKSTLPATFPRQNNNFGLEVSSMQAPIQGQRPPGP